MARRVNTQFLIVFSVIVVGGVLAAFIVAGPGKYWFRGNPSKQFVADGDALAKAAENAGTAAERKEKLDAAVRNFQQAIAADPKNTELYVRVGDLLSSMAAYDPNTFIGQSRGMWEKALEINPDYLPALRRLQDSYYRETQLGGRQAGLFSRLRERAAQVHKLDPNDVRAEALQHIPVLNQWLSNIETSEADVDAAVNGLTPLIEKYPAAPERADMAFYVALAKAKRGLEARRAGQSAAGDELLNAASQVFEDALKGHESDGPLHYRYYEFLRFVRGNDFARDAQRKYGERMREHAEAAVKLADPEKDPGQFVRAHVAAQEAARAQGDAKRADEVVAAMYKARPDDQEVRLTVAKQWGRDAARRDEAIALLEKPIVDAGGTGVDARRRAGLEVQTLLDLANLYAERYPGLKEADRAAELKRIDATYDRLVARAGERAEVLKLRGRVEQLRGGQDALIRSIQTMEKAQAQSVIESGREDIELTMQLGRLYLQTRQTGQAKGLLQKVVRVAPEHAQARLMLAQALIAEGDLAGAREQLDAVEKRTPDDAEFLRLRLATLKPGDALAAKAYFNRLPEDVAPGSPADPAARRRLRMMKAQMAPLAPISSPDEALRLYNLVLAENPADVEALQGARSVLVAQGKKDDAIALLSAGQAKAPDANTADRIGLLIKQLQGASSDELKAAAEELLRKQEDPLTREIKLYELRMAAGDRDEALKHLRAAEQVKWDDARVLDQMFQYYAGARDWAKAAWYVDRLAEKNVDQAGGLIYRTRLSLQRGDTDAAIDTAREMTVRLKEFAPSWVLLGQAQQAAGRYDDAIASYAAALEKQSENPDAIDGIINCYYGLNRPADALQYIQRGLRANPNSARLQEQWRAYQLSPMGDPTLLIKPSLAERDASPASPTKWLNLGRAQLAAARKKDGNSAKYAADAKATFAEAAKRWPAERSFWAYLAEVASFAGDQAGAEAVLKEMLARPEFEKSPEPSMMLADHYLRNGDPAAAEATMRRAVDRFPGNVDLGRRLAAYYTQLGRFDDALKLLDPASPDKMVRQQVVEVYMLSRQFGKAEGLLNTLIDADPKDAQLQALRGVVYLNQEKPEKALKAFDEALSIDPKNQAALYSRGAMRLGGGNPQLEEAVKDLTKLRDVAPGHVDGRVSLAEAFRQRQQYDAAARELEEALKLAPGRRDVRINLVRMYTNSFRPPALGEAERLIEQGKQAEPRDVMWPRMLASLYAQRGAFDRAVREIEAAFAVDQKNLKEIKDYRPSSDLLRDYLDVLEQGRMWAQLAQQTDRVLQDKDAAATAWWVYVKRAVARANTGRKPDALADFQRALEIAFADKNVGPEVQSAIIDRLGETVDAPTASARVAELAKQPGPDGTRWQVVLAALTLRTGDRAKAVAQADEARAKFAALDDRGRLPALGIVGNIYMAGYAAEPSAATIDKARVVYEELLAARPEDLNALNNLANIFAELRTPPDLPKALEYCQRAYEVLGRRSPEPLLAANLLDTIGWVNVLSGGANLDRGVEYLNNSIRAAEIPEAHYHLGVALLRKNSPVPAKRSLLRAGEMIQAKLDAKQEVDKTLKGKVDQALADAEKALFAPRAGTP